MITALGWIFLGAIAGVAIVFIVFGWRMTNRLDQVINQKGYRR